MSGDSVVRRASYGLELVDELTQGELVGTSQVSFDPVAPPLAGSAPLSFLVNRSRWVFENLDADVVFSIAADHYLPVSVQTGGSIPGVPNADDAGVLATVTLRPRTGYPFAPSLTRVVGEVRVSAAIDPLRSLVFDAQVTITPLHADSAVPEGPDLVTKTADDGQYVMWFLPDLSKEPPTATAYRATATAIVNVGGVPTPLTGSIPDQTLVFQTFNGAPPIYLGP
jgi:hypothetical protein